MNTDSAPINDLSRYGYLLQNAAVEPDGIELDFQGDRCGKSYWIKRNCIKTWDCYFWDWHEEGWKEVPRQHGFQTKKVAIEVCNQHAVETKLIKFLPNRPRFKPRHLAAAMSGAVAAAAANAFGF